MELELTQYEAETLSNVLEGLDSSTFRLLSVLLLEESEITLVIGDE